MKIKKKKTFYDIEKHGITQSLLSIFLECKEKAKQYLEGWDSRFHRLPLIEGTVGHAILQYAYEDVMNKKISSVPSALQVSGYIDRVEREWKVENPRPDKEALEHLEYSFMTMEATLPLYFEFWKKDLKEIKWLGLEKHFSRLFSLPDGRKTILRGKRDGEFEAKGLWLFETKFKSQIPEGNLMDTLSFETQVMFYLRELKEASGSMPKGTLYNIVRRNNLRQKKGEGDQAFKTRLRKDIESRPEFYFIRYEIAIDQTDLQEFEKQLTAMVTDFYNWRQGSAPHYKNTYACIGKYGRCTFLGNCSSGDTSDLMKRKTVFKELEDL